VVSLLRRFFCVEKVKNLLVGILFHGVNHNVLNAGREYGLVQVDVRKPHLLECSFVGLLLDEHAGHFGVDSLGLVYLSKPNHAELLYKFTAEFHGNNPIRVLLVHTAGRNVVVFVAACNNADDHTARLKHVLDGVEELEQHFIVFSMLDEERGRHHIELFAFWQWLRAVLYDVLDGVRPELLGNIDHVLGNVSAPHIVRRKYPLPQNTCIVPGPTSQVYNVLVAYVYSFEESHVVGDLNGLSMLQILALGVAVSDCFVVVFSSCI